MSLKGNATNYEKLRGEVSFPKSIQGKSAYEIALLNGFDGTEEEWLDSLKGENGDKGEDGNDYILTDEDKNDITNLVLENFVDVAVVGQ